MNPMTNVKNIQKLNDKVLQLGVEDDISWHKQYQDSAYIFIGGLPYDLTEGDILCVFSQYGEIIHLNLVRDQSTGKSKGYGFICYENQKSTILAVDNFNGIKLGGRTIRVDHVSDYKRPKGEKDESGERQELPLVSCAPKTPPSSEEDPVEKRRGKKKKEKSGKREKTKRKEERKKQDMLEREKKIRKLSGGEKESDRPKDNIGDEKWREERRQNTNMDEDSKIPEKERERERMNYCRERLNHNEIERIKDIGKRDERRERNDGKERNEEVYRGRYKGREEVGNKDRKGMERDTEGYRDKHRVRNRR